MISGTPVPATDDDAIVAKKLWVAPLAAKLDLGDAEAGDGTGPDGGLIS